MNKTKPLIAVDIDDVLADYAESFVVKSNQLFGTELKREDYQENWYELWNIPEAEIFERRRKLFETDMHEVMSPKSNAQKTLELLSKKFRLLVITSRHIDTRDETLSWLEKHYPMIAADQIHFSGVWDDGHANAVHRTKGDIAKRLRVDYLIDDQKKHCFAAAQHGITSLLFGSQKDGIDQLPKNVIAVKDWQAVLEYFEDADK